MQNVNYNNCPSAATTNKQAGLLTKVLLVAGPSILLSTAFAAGKSIGADAQKNKLQQ